MFFHTGETSININLITSIDWEIGVKNGDELETVTSINLTGHSEALYLYHNDTNDLKPTFENLRCTRDIKKPKIK